MTRILGWFAVVVALCVTAAGATPGSITGYVRNSAGVAQMGATVEVLGTPGQSLVVYTDAKGFFTLNGLLPGSYDVRVSAPSFLPAVREDVALAAGASKILNITLNTLFEAVRMLPTLKQGNDEDDSWKWTLRSNSNRPILRFDDGGPVIVESASEDKATTGTLAVMAGGSSEGYGSASDLGTVFNVEHSLFHTATVGLEGSLGYATGTPDGVIRASYSRPGQGRLDADTFLDRPALRYARCSTAPWSSGGGGAVLFRRLLDWRRFRPSIWWRGTEHSVSGTRSQCLSSLCGRRLALGIQYHPRVSLRHQRAQHPRQQGFRFGAGRPQRNWSSHDHG